MTKQEFNKEISLLKNKLCSIQEEYLNSNEQYHINDILKVTFHKCHQTYIYTCRIVNIYLVPEDHEFLSTTNWPSTNIAYFTRFCWKDKNINQITIGGHCPMSILNTGTNICGHLGIDTDTLHIEVIDESQLTDTGQICITDPEYSDFL